MRTFDCDALIIGSGFGGAVMAARLALKNHRVVVLERGRRWTADTYPHKSGDWFWNEKRPERQHGWFDFRFFPQMGVVQGAGVGGGSLVYANASVTAKEDTFKTGWPAEIRYQDLLPYYDKVRTMLHAEPLPATQATARGELLRLAADRLGFDKRVEELDLAVSYDPKWSYSLPDPHNPKH
jgi:cholesterol oxidase